MERSQRRWRKWRCILRVGEIYLADAFPIASIFPQSGSDCGDRNQPDGGRRIYRAGLERTGRSIKSGILGQDHGTRDKNTNTKDPIFQKCQPYGVPRLGAPTKIVQTANEVIFLLLHPASATHAVGLRDHLQRTAASTIQSGALDVTYYGDSRSANGMEIPLSSTPSGSMTSRWLDKGGYFHSDLMHVIEDAPPRRQYPHLSGYG